MMDTLEQIEAEIAEWAAREDDFTPAIPSIYVAGPMRGYDQYNFPAFFRAERDLIMKGWDVLNPAAMDVAEGFDGSTEPTEEFISVAIHRDVQTILHRADAIALLPGWRNSVGATAEAWLGHWTGIDLYQYPEMERVHLEVGQ